MTKQFISIHKVCESYQVPDSFIEALQQFELIPLKHQADELMIDPEILPDLEKIMRLHFDLNINMEGIDVIINLLQQIEELKDEIQGLKNRLRLYEEL